MWRQIKWAKTGWVSLHVEILVMAGSSCVFLLQPQHQTLLRMELTSHNYIKIMSRVAFLRIIIGKHGLFFPVEVWWSNGSRTGNNVRVSVCVCVCGVTGAVVCFCFGSQVGPMRGCQHNGPSLLLRGCSHWEASLWTASQPCTMMPVWLYLLIKRPLG